MKIKTLLFILFVLLIVSANGQTGVTIGPESLDLILSHYTNQLVDTLEINIENGSDKPLKWELSVRADQVYFIKENYADWTLPENQDRITDGVWITRGNDEGIFNVAKELEYSYSNSGPAGTEWASMPTALAGPEDYGTWRDNAHPYRDGGIGKTVSLHLIEEDLYFDVVFHSWTSGEGEGGGGFSYTRINTNPDWLKVSMASDTTASGENQIVKVTFNAEELKKGDYFAEIVINTSDMFLYHVKLPVHLTVEGPSPEISVSPESFMTTLSHYTGVLEESLVLDIQNVGDAPLEVSLKVKDINPTGVFFRKENYADWTLPENQDSISPSCIITRADNMGLFNIASEAQYSDYTSPAGTEWATGPTAEVGPEDYGSWEEYAHPYQDGGIGKTVSLHLIEEDLCFDVVFHSWTSGEDEGGGGFSYTRYSTTIEWLTLSTEADTIDGGTSLSVDVSINASELIRGDHFAEIVIFSNDSQKREIVIPVHLFVDRPTPDIVVNPESLSMTLSGYDKGLEGTQTLTISNTGDDILKWDLSIHGEQVHFKKENYAYWTLPENQDSISPDCIITRADNMGLFNIASEAQYSDYTSPAGTEWATGPTAEVGPEDYGSWEEYAHPYGYGGRGKTVSLHLIEEDLYFDVVFHSWTSGEDEGGGGFSYTRTVATQAWLSILESEGSIDPGEHHDMDVTFSALDLEHGNYFTSIWIKSNDLEKPLVEVPAHLELLLPHPEITIVPDSVNASLSQYSGPLTDTKTVTITNTGDAPLELDLSLKALTFIGEFFKRPDNADWKLAENQDSISPTCFLTRASTQGLFNIASEATYDRSYHSSPAGTEWASVPTSDAQPEDYGTWRENAHPHRSGGFGKTVSLHVIKEDLYFDVIFNRWTVGNNGGGFSYSRGEGTPSWVSISETDTTLDPDEALNLEITFNAEGLGKGDYFANVIIENNVPGAPEIVLPAHLFLDGPAPQIVVTPDSLSSTLSYYTGTLSETKPLVISNTGDKNLEWEITVCGPPVTFTKPNYADWTKPEFQDRITDNVILTRADEEGLFNIALESGFGDDGPKIELSPPTGTEWASMPTNKAGVKDYGNWEEKVHPYRDNTLGKVVSLHLIEDDLYFDVVFHSWTSGEKEGGGGFSYTRVRVNPSWVSASITADTTASGSSENIDVIFNAKNMMRGSYFANIKINSNDAENPVVRILVKIIVEQPLPEIAVDSKLVFAVWSEATGEIDSSVSVEINNAGDDTLRWYAYTFGEPFFFAKENYANWKWPINQDRITDSVWITRADEEGLFNAAKELEYSYGSPAGTEWATGPTAEVGPEDYGPWEDNAHPYQDGGIGKTVSLHLIEEDLYFDVVFHSWTSGEEGGGGGFSYTRRQVFPSWFSVSPDSTEMTGGETGELVVEFNPESLDEGNHFGQVTIMSNDPFMPIIDLPVHLFYGTPVPEIVIEPDSLSAIWSSIGNVFETEHVVKITNAGTGRLTWSADMPVFFNKRPYVDWTLPDNQDHITDNVILTRADTKAFFNIAQESAYSGTSPAGTEWAYGLTVELIPGDYKDWVSAVSSDPQGMIGHPMSLHIIQEDLYYDIVFHSWGGGNTGGGMSYTRVLARPSPEKASAVNYITITPGGGALAGGESQELLVSFDPANLPFGEHKAPIVLFSNDNNKPVVNIPTSFFVEIEAPPSDFALMKPVDDEVVALTFNNLTDTLFFEWQKSVDPNGEEVVYEFMLSDMLIPLAATSEYIPSDTKLGVSHENLLTVLVAAELPSITGTWGVAAISSKDTTYSTNGPFTLTIDASAVGIDGEEALPSTYTLHQNYPNPFNPTTTIRYDLPEQAMVLITIYDITGRKIRSLINRQEEPGYISVVWDARNNAGVQVGTGIYFFSIRTDDYSKTRKMLLVK